VDKDITLAKNKWGWIGLAAFFAIAVIVIYVIVSKL